MDLVDPRDLDLCVTGCARSHQRLLADLDELDPADLTGSSRLPGWSRAHVVAHLVGNARGLIRMLEAADGGEIAEQYPGGARARRDEIETLAASEPRDLLGEVRLSIWAFETAIAGLGARGWSGRGRTLIAEIPIVEIPLRRWREAEIYHGDLDIGFEVEDWDPAFVSRDLEEQRRRYVETVGSPVPAAAQDLAAGLELAWLYGRVSIEGLGDAPPL